MQPGLSITPLVNHDALGISSDFAFSNIDETEGIIEGLFALRPFRVSIFAKSKDADRYINPLLDITLADRRYCFELQNGRTCMGCAIRLSCRILSVLQEQQSAA